ncbi:hypothetical protein GCM10010472_69210 [Pseudonocardia halophobica]|uniref:CoA transferase n=1 Tax=Pseudonocardia halophobica TaxID=29401 RepID=A0A9W6UE35_9PSEU|nr:CoA transferase [Pseudonocardia halophobica]GLL15830.1 hypothetical protein GCM10017577_69840 [Pseudonocardia halophobica]
MKDVSGELLAGLRVVELSTRVAGAYCGRILRLHGATVSRWVAPTMADCPPGLLTLLEESLHEGKTTLGPDGPSADDLARADVVVVDSLHDDAYDGAWTAATRRALERVPAGCPVVDVSAHAEQLRERSGAPRAAPEPGGSLTASAASAMSWSIGSPGLEPLALPYDLADYLAGTEAAGAAALALAVGAAGAGVPNDYWDISAGDVVSSYVGQICAVFLPFGRPWVRDGPRATGSGGFYPGAMFRCRDGQLTLVCRTDREWAGLRKAMGDPEWSREPRFADAREVARSHADEADRYVSAWTESHTCAEITALGQEFGFAVAQVLTPAQGARLEQFAHNGFVERDSAGAGTRPGRPWRVLDAAEVGVGAPLALRPTPERPLAGLTVLDLSWVWSGPMLTAQLADLGAEVLKVESRSRPDPARSRGRALRDGVPLEGPDLEVSTYFGQMNRGKRSLALNIGTEEGADVVRRLAATVDVVVENMRPGALDRRSLGYADLATANPGLIMLSMSMMGQEGPMRGLGGYAPVMSGLAGADAIVGYSPDQRIGLYNPSLGDPNGAAHAMTCLLAALVRRQRTGRGGWVDVAQIACLMATARAALIEDVHLGEARVPGNGHAVFWPHGAFRCAGEDEWVALAVRTDRERERLRGVVGGTWTEPTGAADAVRRWADRQDAATAAFLLRGANLDAARIDSFERLADSGWAKERRLSAVLDHRYLGPQPVFHSPWKRDGRVFSAPTPAPLLGDSTESVLRERLGVDDDQLAVLRAAGAIE